MKYALHIAFNKSVGDILLRICEYAKKFGNSSANFINPLLFEFSDTNKIEVKRPEKNIPLADFALFALEMYYGIQLRWMTENVATTLIGNKGVEEFFEREFSDKIVEENDIDPEMHIIFYVPLYESDIYQKVRHIINNLPVGHKFVVNVISITYDIAWACKMLDNEIDKDTRGEIMFRNIMELKNMMGGDICNCTTLIKHIFLFQNYNIGGWSQNFTIKKLIEICANLSLALVQHYDTICHYSWLERPIYAINVQSRVIDIYLAVNYIFRDLFTGVADINIINPNEIDKTKVKNAFTKILGEEINLIDRYKELFILGLTNQLEYNNAFNSEVKGKLKEVISDNIETYKLNVSEQQYLYSLFNSISEKTSFEHINIDDTIWQLEEMIIRELDGDQNLLEAYNKLKRCSKELTETNNKIKSLESVVSDLQSKLISDYPNNVELTNEGYKIGNEIFKPYKLQDEPLDITYVVPINQVLPPSVDLRDSFPEIKSQGSQGACTAFSLVSVIEYFMTKNLRDNANLSEAFVYYNARVIRNETEIDSGATFVEIIQSIRDKGVCLEELCPYNQNVCNERPSEEAYDDAVKRKITEAKNVCINVNDVKSALAQGYPVIISARAFDSYLSNRNGVLRIPTDKELENTENNHAMVICGYIDKEGFFVVRNSWGKNFGDNGYCYMPYEYFRKSNAINQAYVVTGLNIKAFKPKELSSIDSLLDGKDINAQYSIYQNILIEASHELEINRTYLNVLHQEYLNLFNKIADYSGVELTLKDLKEKNEEKRLELENRLREIAIKEEKEKYTQKGLLDRLGWFKVPSERYLDEKKKIEDKLEQLDHYADEEKRKYRIRMAILNGLKEINKECIEESVQRQNLSQYYAEQKLRIEDQNKTDEKEYNELKHILPMDDIITHLRMSDITVQIKDLGRTISRIINGESGLYESFSDLQNQVMTKIANELNVRISDHLANDCFDSFYKQISRSSVMIQVHGGVPEGYGDETKYFFCNLESLPKRISKEAENVMLLPIKDNLRMCFLHIEKYDIDDLVIFYEANRKLEN